MAHFIILLLFIGIVKKVSEFGNLKITFTIFVHLNYCKL